MATPLVRVEITEREARIAADVLAVAVDQARAARLEATQLATLERAAEKLGNAARALEARAARSMTPAATPAARRVGGVR